MILAIITKFFPCTVAPHEGAWIEILQQATHPTEERVAPHEGAWIEILRRGRSICEKRVAPHEGAWIEINIKLNSNPVEKSHPTRVRGLK